MIDTLLRAKHWQLFLILIGPPLIFQFIVIGGVMSQLSGSESPNLDSAMKIFRYFPLIMIITMGVLFGWLWSIVIGLKGRLPEGVILNWNRFKIFFFIPLFYILLLSLLLPMLIEGIINKVDSLNGRTIGMTMAIIIPLHFISIFGILHSFYYAAKTLKIVELQKEVSFSDFAGEFFLIWFYPIGVWILQPKVNKFISEK